ncbi:MAG: hypothetical protein HYZ81_21165 [Nitrospinae bacterium]|nr:hypothetical protein [Nitrospinota bacterium]
MAVPLLTADQIRQVIPALHKKGSGHFILSDLYALGLAYGVIRIFERRPGGRVVATLGTLATDVPAILVTLEQLGHVWPAGAAEKPLWKVVDNRGTRLGVFANEKVADGFAKGWVFQQGRQGLVNFDFGEQATVIELSEEDRAELARAPEREPEILMERTP